VRNGIVPVRLPSTAVGAIAAAVAPDPPNRRVTVDLATQRVTSPDGTVHEFEIEPEAREMLLEGLDAIDLTLKSHDDIAAFVARDRSLRPWIYLD
jgi:3-isopropylmalate/(R)-2-methylmalate dehydratase small subunit